MKKRLVIKEFNECPILVMANNQDFNGALSPDEIEEKLGMSQIKNRLWKVLGTSSNTGQGLKESLEWIASVLKKCK